MVVSRAGSRSDGFCLHEVEKWKKLEDIVWEKISNSHAITNAPQTLIIIFSAIHGTARDRLMRTTEAFAELPFLEATQTVIARKGREQRKNRTYFGMPHPEAMKALRLRKQAEKFKRPIILIIDTPGAYRCRSRRKGQASAIP